MNQTLNSSLQYLSWQAQPQCGITLLHYEKEDLLHSNVHVWIQTTGITIE